MQRGWTYTLTSKVVGRVQADANLGKFLDYCTYGHMIDNVVLIVTGTLHERDVQVRGRRTGDVTKATGTAGLAHVELHIHANL